jgi:hypothetical protein
MADTQKLITVELLNTFYSGLKDVFPSKDVATTSAAGLLSADDKTKLDGIAAGATKVTVDEALSDSSTNPVQNKAVNTALAGKVDKSTTVNGKALSANITLSASDVGADESGAAAQALTDAKSYADTKVADLVNNAPETLDTLGEIAEALNNNADIVDAINEAIGKKADASALTDHTGDTTVHITASERTNWNAAYTHSQEAHAPANAEENQNAIANVEVGGVTIAASAKQDTVKLAAGDNVTLSADADAKTVTIKATDTTYDEATKTKAGLLSASDKSKLDGIAEGANKYELPTASSTLGGVKTTSDVSDVTGYTAAPIVDGVVYYKNDNTTYADMVGATADSDGAHGLVPAPSAGQNDLFLRGDGTYAKPTDTTYSAATQSTDGLLSASDKTKLDSLVIATDTDIAGIFA